MQKAMAAQDREVKDITGNFGVVIAFVLPGVVALWGIGYQVPDVVHGWFKRPEATGFLFVVLVSLAVGVFVSGLRWLFFEKVCRSFGLEYPSTDYRRLTSTDAGMRALSFTIEHTYRHYQFNANMAVALMLAYGARLSAGVTRSCSEEIAGLALLVAVVASLLASARSCLGAYYKDLRELDREGG
jgi:hypothetical protein